MNTSGFIAIVVALAIGFAAGYRYATRPLQDTGPKSGPRIVEKDEPVKPPEPKHVQTPVRRETHPTAGDTTVCLAADRAFMGLTSIPVRFTSLKPVNFASLRVSWLPAVTYVDPETERLAVTRSRNGSLSIPYTYKGTTRIDTYALNPPAWDLFLEVEGKLFGSSFAAVDPVALQTSAMAWLRIRRWELGAGVLARVERDEDAEVLSVAGIRYKVWGLR